jgi:peptidoglycan/LPS O-acetylase OafA/YrhL
MKQYITTNSVNQASNYRLDIDGLRAIAVLSVILFHIKKALLPGGFIGVDVFFVISGFLITSHIVQDINRSRFSILNFYRRRIKRIVPAMLVVVSVTLFFSWFLLLPEDATAAAKSAVFSLFSLANVYFWLYRDTSYFAQSTSELPLLHLWSLGIEEQFYVIWPLLLIWLYQPGCKKLFFSIAMTFALFSYVLGNLLFHRYPLFVYYMLPTRAGELLLGALVAIAVLRGVDQKLSAAMSTSFAITGMLLLASSMFFLSEDSVFPGLLALPPTLGTSLIIFAGHSRSNILSDLLSKKPLVQIGLISYSLYLWHWPLLAFYRYGYGNVDLLAAVSILILTYLLAWLTYHYVEQPARNSTASVLQVFIRQYATPSVVLLVLSFSIVYANRLWPDTLHSDYMKHLTKIRDESRPAYQYDYVCQRQKLTEKDALDLHCVVGADLKTSPRVLLWGDSNAAHYIGMIGSFAKKAGFNFRNIEIGSCPPILGETTAFVDPHRAEDCESSLTVVRPMLEKAEVIIISAAWTSYQQRSSVFLDSFFHTVRDLTDKGKQVIIIGKVPVISGFDRLCREKALRFPFLNCPIKKMPLSVAIYDMNARLSQFANKTAHVRYFDATAFLCPKGMCSAYDGNGNPMYFDEEHLTMAASWELGKEILLVDGVPEPFRQRVVQ